MKIKPEDLVKAHGSIKLEGLKPLKNNAHRADEDALRRSLTEFGQFESIAVHKNTVLIGNHRVAIAQELGWDTLAGYDLSGFRMSVAERIARALASNRIAQLGYEDDQALMELLDQVNNPELIEAAGYDPEDVEDLLAEIDSDDDVTIGGAEPILGPSARDQLEHYTESETRMIMLTFPAADYPDVVAWFEHWEERFGVDSHAAVILEMVKEDR